MPANRRRVLPRRKVAVGYSRRSHDASRLVERFLPLALLGIWFAVVASEISLRSFWLDETDSLRFAAMPWPQLWNAVGRFDPMFGEYYALLHLWNVVDTSVVWERSLSVAFATGTLAVSYRLASLAFGRRVAFAAVTVLALQPRFLHEATEARPYALVTFGFAVTLLLWQQALRDDRLFTFLALCASALATIYAHAIVVLGLLTLAVSLAFPPYPRARVMRRMALVTIAVLLGTVPLLWLVVHAESPADHWQHNPDSIRAAFSAFGETFSGTLRPLPVALALFVTGIVALVRSGYRRDAVVLASLVVMPILGLATLSLVRPLFVPRYVAYISVPECIVIGRGLIAVWNARIWRPVALIAALYLAIVGIAGGRLLSGDGFDWGAVAAIVRSDVRDDDALAVLPAYDVDPLRFARGGALPGTLVFPRDVSLARLLEGNEHVRSNDARRLATRYQRIWIVREPAMAIGTLAQPEFVKALMHRYRLALTTSVRRNGSDVEIDRYDRREY